MRGAAPRGLVVAVLCVLIAVAALLRLPLLRSQPIQHDEVYSYLAALGFLHHGISVFDPTGYPYPRAFVHQALAAAALGLLGEDLASSRLLSVLASLVSIPVLYVICRAWAGRAASLVACALLAVSTWEGFLAVSARMYAVFQLFFCVALWCALRVADEPRRRSRWLALVASTLAAAGTHELFLISAPLFGIGLVVLLRGHLPLRPLLLVVGLFGIATAAGLQLESTAPWANELRQEYGTWSLPLGNPLRNVGLLAIDVVNERAPLVAWLAALAIPYAVSRRSRALGFAAFVAFGSGLGIAAGGTMQGPRYYYHLLPLFLGLACGAVEFLVRDARHGHDVVREWVEGATALSATLRRRLPALPSDRALLLLAAGAFASLAVAGELLSGGTPGLGRDQRLLLAGATALTAGVALWPLWCRAGRAPGRVFLGLLALVALVSLPAWASRLGPYRFPPFQAEAFQALEDRLRPGDRVLATEHLSAFLHFDSRVPLGLLSQRLEGGRFVRYDAERDWVTGIPLVDDPDELAAWLQGGGRVFVLTDFRLDLHLDEALRRRIEELPLVYRSDPSRLAGLPPHPEWGGDTNELRLWVAGGP